MTTIVSVFGILGRFAGDLLMSALGWASSLLFGRVPRSHQIYLVLMMAGSFLWIVAVLGLVVPSLATIVLIDAPSAVRQPALVHGRAVVAVVALPVLVGAAGYLVPADGERVKGASVVVELLRGYLLTPLSAALLIFMAGRGDRAQGPQPASRLGRNPRADRRRPGSLRRDGRRSPAGADGRRHEGGRARCAAGPDPAGASS